MGNEMKNGEKMQLDSIKIAFCEILQTSDISQTNSTPILLKKTIVETFNRQYPIVF